MISLADRVKVFKAYNLKDLSSASVPSQYFGALDWFSPFSAFIVNPGSAVTLGFSCPLFHPILGISKVKVPVTGPDVHWPESLPHPVRSSPINTGNKNSFFIKFVPLLIQY